MTSAFAITVCVIVLICLTLMINAQQRRRGQQKPSTDGGSPENIHYSSSGNDLWSWLFSGEHSAHHHSSHSDGSHSGGGSDSGGGHGGGDGGGGGNGGGAE